MPDYEITALGFDGGDDMTDDRVLWIAAPDLSVLRDALRDAPYRDLAELPDTGSIGIDFTLPRDTQALRDKLDWFAAHPPGANDFGMRCPTCGASDQLDVSARVWLRLCSDGTDQDLAHNLDHEWDDDSPCHCAACGWTGTVLNASPDDEKDEAPQTMTFTNYYLHCGKHWRDHWSAMCNDDCPACGHEIEPYKSVDADGETINHVGDQLVRFEQGEDA